jgi:hypothetical protein
MWQLRIDGCQRCDGRRYTPRAGKHQRRLPGAETAHANQRIGLDAQASLALNPDHFGIYR